MKKVKVAIFTSYYNRENDVEDSINSLLNQTYDDFIVIAINDGSTDDTFSRLNKIKNDKLIIINKNNSGFVDSMKKAISEIDSEFIAIHGSGDISYPDRIEQQVNVLEDDKTVGIVGCHYKNTDLTREVSIEFTSLIGFVRGDDMLKKLKHKNPLTQGEIMIRRSIYNEVDGYNTFFTFSQDYDLWVRMSKITNFHIIPKILYERFVRLDGVSGNVNTIAIQQYLASIVRLNITNTKSNINIVDFVSKKRDPILAKRLIRLSLRALIYENSYPVKLAKINRLELGFFGVFINLFLNFCRFKSKSKSNKGN